jgi:tellurium resistance protein TerD
MSHNLTKGSRFNLSKDAPGMTKVKLGLGWPENPFDTGHKWDLDVSLFGLGANGKIIDDAHFIYYNQKQTPNGSIVHSGDNTVGNTAGDDETILVDLALLDPKVTELSVIVTIHDAANRGQKFGQIPGCHINLYDAATGEKKSGYDLEDDFTEETAVQFGSLFKKDGAWLFKAVGQGFKKGLQDFVDIYTVPA